MDINVITEKLTLLQDAEKTLTEDIREAHGVEDEDEEVLLNWDEQRDFEYLYDRIDLFTVLHSLIGDDKLDPDVRNEMLRVLSADAQEIIAERKADIEKAQAVIDDMNQLLTLCKPAEGAPS